jgi:hypothetical protein
MHDMMRQLDYSHPSRSGFGKMQNDGEHSSDPAKPKHKHIKTIPKYSKIWIVLWGGINGRRMSDADMDQKTQETNKNLSALAAFHTWYSSTLVSCKQDSNQRGWQRKHFGWFADGRQTEEQQASSGK